MSEVRNNMSEFEQNWPVVADLREHQRYAQTGLDTIHDQLVLPEDGRWDIAYGGLVMGSPNTAVLAEGDPGTGKTEFGNIVLGETVRVDVASTDTPETLEGYIRPTDGEYNPGKMTLDEESLRLFLNEVSHLRDTGPLHKYWDGKSLTINGREVSLENISTYMTTNFADGRRAKELDPALRSRAAISILAGDNTAEIAESIHSIDTGKHRNVRNQHGLLPHAKTRQDIREKLEGAYPTDRQSGMYITRVVQNLNESGLISPITLSDKRISSGWQQAERARRLLDGGSGETRIKPTDLSKVAALALGSVATMTAAAGSEFQEKLGKINRLSPLEKAVITRRAIAAVAFKTVVDMGDFVERGNDERMARFMDTRSYASVAETDQLNGLIIDHLNDHNQQTTESERDDAKKSRGLFRRRSS